MMSYRIAIPISAIVFLVFIPVAKAQDRTGWALSGGIGPTYLRDEDSNDTFSGNAWGFILGIEYRFVPRFALGVNVYNLGSADDNFNGVETNLKVKAIDLSGRIILPVSEKTELYGVIGGASYYADLDPGGFNLFGDDAWVFGAGVDFHTSEKFAVRLEGRYFNGVRDESGSIATFGFSYRF